MIGNLLPAFKARFSLINNKCFKADLKKIFSASTITHKLKLRQELNNIRQQNMSITDYTTKIKEICDALGSINVMVDEEEMVQTCLDGLAHQ